jgi:DNA-binding CsgD family transcriptional regulator
MSPFGIMVGVRGVTASRLEREIVALADAAQVTTPETFRAEALACLDRVVGIDLGMSWTSVTPSAPARYRVSSDAAALIARRHTAFVPTLVRLLDAAAARGGVVLDARLFSAREMAGQPLYEELGRCLGARQHMTIRLAVRGRALGGTYVARTGARARPFTDEDVARVRRLLPVLSLGEAAPPPAEADPAGALTAREREVLELFGLGASYADVGLALGVSINTIRQHVRAIYDKLHVASKAEAVMRVR